MNRKETILKLREKRYTYKCIGKLLGISRQRIHQIITGYKSPSAIRKRDLALLSKEERKKTWKEKLRMIKERREEKYKQFLRDIELGKIIDTRGIKLQGREFVREAIRRRDNYTCQMCNKVWNEGERRLDVHHIDCDKEKTRQYDNLEKEKDNMITLCHKCHLNIDEHRSKMSSVKRT